MDNDMDSPAEEAGETPQEQSAEENQPTVNTPISFIGGIVVGAHSDRHQSMFNHKAHHKKKHGY